VHGLSLSRGALLALAALGAACEGPGPKEGATPAEVVATVNDRVLTEADLASQPATRGHQQGRPETREAVLDALVTEELAAQSAEAQGLEPDARSRKELAQLEAARVAARRRGLANAWYAQVTRQALQITSTEVQGYVAAHRQELRREVHVVMALRRSEAELRTLLGALDAGTSLETVLKAESAGLPGTPWDLGWLGYGQLAPAWRPVLASMKPGQVSEVVKGDHGRFWVLQLLEVREGPEQPPEALQAMVQQLLGADRALPARAAAEAALREKGRVVLGPGKSR